MTMFKPPKIVSQKIRQSARGEQCLLRMPGCEHTGTVVCAHLNSRFKGTGNKSPDIFVVYACNNCHGLLDSGRVPASEQLRALQETQIKLVQKGLIEVKK